MIQSDFHALNAQFEISLEDLKAGEDIATCPSCSLLLRVIFDEEDFASSSAASAASGSAAVTASA